MIAWISENIGTIIVTILLILLVGGIIRSMMNDKKKGMSVCGGNCTQCKMCTSCRKKT